MHFKQSFQIQPEYEGIWYTVTIEKVFLVIMIEEIKLIRKRKKEKHRLRTRMRKRVYIVLATAFFAIGIVAIINFNTNVTLH